MSDATLSSKDCHLCHSSVGIFGCFRSCSGKSSKIYFLSSQSYRYSRSLKILNHFTYMLFQVMKDGRIVQSGKYEDLIADPNGELVRQMAAHRKSLNQVSPPQVQHSLTRTSRKSIQNEVIEENFQDHISSCKLLERSHEEEAETGRVKWHVYSTFISCAYKGALVPIILLCQVMFQGLQMGSNYWIAWATEEEGKVSRKQLIGIFVLMSGGSSIFILGRAVLLTTIAIETSQRLFHSMTASVFRAPISFFDCTPSSRILSRVSFLSQKTLAYVSSMLVFLMN